MFYLPRLIPLPRLLSHSLILHRHPAIVRREIVKGRNHALHRLSWGAICIAGAVSMVGAASIGEVLFADIGGQIVESRHDTNEIGAIGLDFDVVEIVWISG